MGKSILLIDDDHDMGKLVNLTLSSNEIIIFQAYSGTEGLRMAYQLHPDLVILDLMLPGMNGFATCARMRELSSVPILILTCQSSEPDMMRAFKLGADDFIKKPFNKNELEARVRALLRRSRNGIGNIPTHILAYKDAVLEVDLSNKTVKLLGKVVSLSPLEYALLACLVRERGKIVTHHELIQEVWGDIKLNGSSMTSLYIHYLRKKLHDGQHGHEYICTNWGRGYWFEAGNN